MHRLTIDGRTVPVPEGGTILDGARELGIEIPTLCFDRRFDHFTSCMLCVVKDSVRGKFWPACSALAEDGMEIVTNSEEVHTARREALDLLLSEHVGDCEAPCRRACPAHMDIPLMIRQIGRCEQGKALMTVKRHIALPAVLGRICPAPCEKACRRGRHDSPVSICLLKRYVADADLRDRKWLPDCATDSGKTIGIIGAGPAGLAAAYYLRELGHRCVVHDSRDRAGGRLTESIPGDLMPRGVLEAEVDLIRALEVEFKMGVSLGDAFSLDDMIAQFDAVVLAIGSSEKDFLETLELATTPRGVKVDSASFATTREGVFAAGAVTGAGKKMAVRSVADGRGAALSVDKFLATGAGGIPASRFNSTISKVEKPEMEEFLEGVNENERVEPSGGQALGFSDEEASDESARCLHCDCRSRESCRLRRCAQQYSADQRRYRGEERLPILIVRQHADVVYEPGKCIKCGLCVRITEQAGEELGLSFVGRGFDVRVGVPFSESMADALKETAEDCARTCPTGALALAGHEESPDA